MFDWEKYHSDYCKQKYDQFTLRVPAGELEKIKMAAQAEGETINGYINQILFKNIDGFSPVAKPPRPTTVDKIEDDETRQDVKKAMDAAPIYEPDGISVEELAEKVGDGMTRKKMFSLLRSGGYLCNGGSEHNLPTQSAKGLIAVRQSILAHPDGSYRICRTPVITPKGVEYFTNLYKNAPQ